jgi:hypothetical protein
MQGGQMNAKKKPDTIANKSGSSMIKIMEYAECARKLMGIAEDWRIDFYQSDCPGGHSDWNGCCAADSIYLNADITIARQYANTGGPVVKQIVFHEMGHVAHAEVDHAVETILAQVDEKDRGYFTDLYHEATERYIQRQSRVLCQIETEGEK